MMGQAQDFHQLYWMRALMGLSEALYIPAALAMIVDFHQGRTRSLAVGLHMTGLYCGQALGGFGALAAAELSWRTTFHWLGITGVAYGIVLALFLRERKDTINERGRPAHGVGVPPTKAMLSERNAQMPDACPSHELDQDWRARRPPSLSESPAREIQPQCKPTGFLTIIAGMRKSLSALFSIGAFFVILYYFAAPSAPGWVMKSWLPTLFAKMNPSVVREMFPGAAGFNDEEIVRKVTMPLSTIIIAASGFIGVICGGFLADRWARHNVRGRIYTGVIGLAMTIPALLAIGWGGSPALALAATLLYGLGFGLYDANNMPVLCQFVPPHLRAAAYGFMNLVGVSAGALTTELLGKLAKAGKLAQGIGWLAMPVVLAIALVLLLRPTTLNRTTI